MSTTFRPGVDPDNKRFLDEDGRALCRDRFHTYVHNGDVVDTSDVVTHSFLPVTTDQRTVQFNFYRSLERLPEYTDEPRCEPIGTLVIELGEAMNLPRVQRNVEMQFRFGDTEIDVRAVNVHTRQQVDSSLRFDSSY